MTFGVCCDIRCVLPAKFWTAPEVLRTGSVDVNGTQLGDVYSFAIILHEIIFRSYPYEVDGELPMVAKGTQLSATRQRAALNVAELPPKVTTILETRDVRQGSQIAFVAHLNMPRCFHMYLILEYILHHDHLEVYSTPARLSDNYTYVPKSGQ